MSMGIQAGDDVLVATWWPFVVLVATWQSFVIPLAS